MAIARQTMTDEQRKSVALEYLKAFDNGGVTSTGDSTGSPGRDSPSAGGSARLSSMFSRFSTGLTFSRA